MLWSSPIYKFRIPKTGGSSEELKEIIINVTGSAPTFKEPSEALKEVLQNIFGSTTLNRINNVLEFGAGKLKNIPYLLEQGKTVCAVEFEELSENSFTKENLEKSRKHGDRFQELLFPNPFLTDAKKFDLAMLVNVLPVMPVLAERLYLLEVLHTKINAGKYLLWVAQKEGSYKKIREGGRNCCGDGIWMGKGRYVKTFYRYHHVDELDEIMALYGFKLIKRFSVGDDARLYEKTKHRLFNGLITPHRIQASIPSDDSIEAPSSAELKLVEKNATTRIVSPNPRELSIENLYIEKIKSIPRGIQHAEEYHRVASHAIGRIFRGSIRNMDIKVPVGAGTKIVDTVFTNCAKEGFFFNVKSKGTYVNVEMKNITGDPTNDELDQLNGRFNDNRGHFGIMVCRDAQKMEAILARCKTYLPNNYVLVLADEDVFELLEYKRENNIEDINDYMDTKLRNLLY